MSPLSCAWRPGGPRWGVTAGSSQWRRVGGRVAGDAPTSHTQNVSWSPDSRLGNFQHLQLISDYRNDYSQGVMCCVFISLFELISDSSQEPKCWLRLCTRFMSTFAKWLTGGISDSCLSSERALKNTADAAAVRWKGTCKKCAWGPARECVLVTETERDPIWEAQISSSNFQTSMLAESLVVSVVTFGLPFASLQHATDNHCKSRMWTARWHQRHPHSFPGNEKNLPSVVEN